MSCENLARVVLLVSVLAAAGCTGRELVQELGQTLYNSGKYLCMQSNRCDTPDDGLSPSIR